LVLTYAPLLLVVALLVVHFLAVVQDFATAIGSPLEFDYGEGIVWQQAALIPGPSMYSRSQALPFIVFHYPPLFHLLTRAASVLMPSFLAAGRLVSVTATLSIAVFAGGMVALATGVRGRNWVTTDMLSMMIAGMLVLCLHVVHLWGMVMRVDSTAIAFAFAGALVGIRGDGRLAPTTAGMLLCLCAVFTKQTQVSAGIALFLVTVVRAPRSALLAAAITGGVGLGLAGLLQWLTHGGFFLNILEYNINRFSLQTFRDTYASEQTSAFVAIPALATIPILLRNSWRASNPGTGLRARLADRATACRVLLVTYLFFSTLTLVTTFKSGSNFNYLFEWLAVACAVLGVGIADLAGKPSGPAAGFGLFVLLLPVLVFLVFMPTQPLAFLRNSQALALRERLVERIASATKPVASDNMTLLMQAGKRVIFEPAIATELAELGLWDERPLVEMIKAHGFAFIITTGDTKVRAARRTPAVEAAIEEAYPRVEQVGPETWVNSPP
jgi:hypothetical protein